MRLGALVSPFDGSNPRAIPEQARALEGEGFDAMWSAHAMGRGFMMPDPFVSLSAAAAVTEKLELGTAILQLPLYNPTDVAIKSYALSQLSGGRFVLGVGAGSTKLDYELNGLPYGERFKAFEQGLATLRQNFASGECNDVPFAPWESVAGGPPIYFGTWGKNVTRAAEEFDGWIGSGHYRTVEEVIAAHDQYRAAGGKRAMVSTLQIHGDTDLGEMKERLGRYRDAGLDDAVVMIMPGGPSIADVRKLL
ncbi:MAG: LLM class flavin-dependent oxidoreductase [Pseudomonadota bacterium]